ncbi:MAG: flagellar motor protein MotB [Desulfatirhabdiaceae bacterium]
MIKKSRQKKAGSMDSTERISPIWLTTFNDLITLLMVFFVLLFAMSEMNGQKSGQFLQSAQSALGVLKEGKRLGIAGPAKTNSPETRNASTRKPDAETSPEKKIFNHPDVSIVQSAQKLYITIADRILFQIGSPELNSDGYPVLDRIATMLQKMPGHICIEGHTDNTPIQNTRFLSNWELSVARAVHVLKYFLDCHKMDPGRFSVAGYGESRPVNSNDSPELREKNRRVSIIVEMEK